MDAERVYLARPTPEEVAEVLDQRVTATVGTLNEDGSVHLAYVLFLYADRQLYFETSSITRKARNATRRGHISMIVQSQTKYGHHVMVAAEGTPRVIRGDEATRIHHRLRAKYIRPEALAGIDRAWEAIDDIAVQLVPRRWRSWTASVYHDVTSRHLDVPYEEAWVPAGA
jgi:hypothetical protein